LLIVREKRYGYAENLKCAASLLLRAALMYVRVRSLRQRRHALQTCRTSHVLVVQHDQSILRPLQETRIDQIVQLLSSEPQVAHTDPIPNMSAALPPVPAPPVHLSPPHAGALHRADGHHGP
jgi:hypothetical protein